MALYCSAQANWRIFGEREKAARRVWAGVSTGDRVLQIYERSKYDIKFHIFVLPILGEFLFSFW